MPEFDPDDIQSAEFGALWHTIDLLTGCAAVQALAEATGGTAELLAESARQRFIVGPHAGPWDADQFTVAELEARFIEFQLYVPTEGGRTVVLSDSSFTRADEAGEIMLITRRLARLGELAANYPATGLDGRQNLYMWFGDQISAMEAEAMVKAETRECPRLLNFTRQQGPLFGMKEHESAQGEYLYTLHSIGWGDNIEQ